MFSRQLGTISTYLGAHYPTPFFFFVSVSDYVFPCPLLSVTLLPSYLLISLFVVL